MTEFYKDGSGYITKGEMRKAMQKQGLKMTNDETYDKLMKKLDKDGDGKISYEEYFASMVNKK